MKLKFFVALLFVSGAVAGANPVRNYVFAKRDTCTLSMDVYSPIQGKKACLIYVFGGGFRAGSKSEVAHSCFLKTLTDSGYTVAVIDYRLGMKNVHAPKRVMARKIRQAIEMAVEDAYSATDFLVKHAVELNIDPSKIIISGSSAGAITALQADYELANRSLLAAGLPVSFRYAGVIAFAGGIMTSKCHPTYKVAPAPTLFFHGTNDRLVVYNHKRVFEHGFFGANALAACFEKSDYPYWIWRYRDMGHEIAVYPMIYNLSDICQFLREYVINNRHLKKDVSVKDPGMKRERYGSWTPEDLYMK